jgi:beta-glucosidase
MGWEIYPASIVEALLLARQYTHLPLYITENGAAFADQVLPDGTIEDDERVAYLAAHLAEVRRALRAGADVRGYFVWSLLDNFEWEHGFRRRFGLIHVDFATQQRTWKHSASWYRDVIVGNGRPARSRPPA